MTSQPPAPGPSPVSHGAALTRRGAISSLARAAAGVCVLGALPASEATGGAVSVSRHAGRSLAPPPPPPIPSEFRALWVAHVDNIDWPSAPGLSTWRQQHEMARILDAAVACRLNAIILQVRPTADAIYPTRLAPWSAFLSGEQGRGPDPEYDPLRAWIDGAHARGLDLHAWVNPFRVRHPKSIGRDARAHISNSRPDLVRTVGAYEWLDPGEPDSRAFALDACRELLDRYDVDGLHLDDYFYPYPEEGVAFPDGATHRRHGSGRDLGDWRRANIDAMVADLRGVVRASGGHRLFTVSPFGIWRPGHPEGVRGLDAYNRIFADSRGWLRDGLVDALMPQLYWPADAPQQPFEPLLNWWHEQNTQRRHVWPGLYLTRVRPWSEGTSWSPSEIVRQVRLIRAARGATSSGAALFSAVGLVDDHRGVATRLAKEVYDSDAIVPASPWLDAPPAPRPIVPEYDLGGAAFAGRVRLAPAPGGVRRWAVSRRGWDDAWTTTLHPATELDLPLPQGREWAFVRSVGANGAVSVPIHLG